MSADRTNEGPCVSPSTGKVVATRSGAESQVKVEATRHVITKAFFCCMCVSAADQLGISLLNPTLVPYGERLGFDLEQISGLHAVRLCGQLVSIVLLTSTRNICGVKTTLLLSTFGSTFAYMLQAFAGSRAGEDVGKTIYVFGRISAGLFAGTRPIIQAYVGDMSPGDYDLIGKRQCILVASYVLGAPLLNLVGSASAVLGGLSGPYCVAAVGSMIALALVLLLIPNEPERSSSKEAASELVDSVTSRTLGPFQVKWLVIALFTFVVWLVFELVTSQCIVLTPLIVKEVHNTLQGADLAAHIGIVNATIGAFSLLSAALLTPVLARSMGQTTTMLILPWFGGAGLVMMCFVNRYYQCILLSAVFGFSSGPLVRYVASAQGIYIAAKFTRAGQGRAHAMLVTGQILGEACGPPMLAGLYRLSDSSIKLPCVVNAAITVSLCVCAFVTRYVDRAVPTEDPKIFGPAANEEDTNGNEHGPSVKSEFSMIDV